MRTHSHAHVRAGRPYRLAQTTRLTLRLEQNEDIALTDWAPDVADNATTLLLARSVELDTDLRHTAARSSTTEDLLDVGTRALLLIVFHLHLLHVLLLSLLLAETKGGRVSDCVP